MRLIETQDTRGCSPSEMMILARHGVDVDDLTQDLNQPLAESTKPDIMILGKQMIEFCRKIKARQVQIRHSNRLRAIQTAAITAEEFFVAGIPTEIFETGGVREIYQGDFVIKDHINGREYKPLVDAWSVWQQKLDACELLYRFGDPLVGIDGKAEHPELVGWFKKFGEHQGEFSLRLYLLLQEVFEETSDDLQIIIGHQASCSRIQRVINATSKLSSADEFEPGDFVKYLEKSGLRTNIEPACGIISKKPNRDLIIAVLQKEIHYLRSIVSGAL